MPVCLSASAATTRAGQSLGAPSRRAKATGRSSVTRQLHEVWPLARSFVERYLREKGISGPLMAAAVQHARDGGAKFVAAYPVAPESMTHRLGIVSAFEEAGPRFVKPAYTRRNVMILPITADRRGVLAPPRGELGRAQRNPGSGRWSFLLKSDAAVDHGPDFAFR